MKRLMFCLAKIWTHIIIDQREFLYDFLSVNNGVVMLISGNHAVLKFIP